MNAIISTCGTYRYRLERGGHRRKDGGRYHGQPVTADAILDDHTIRKVRRFTLDAGCSRFVVVNKFAYRARDIKALRSAADPIGPENDAHIEQAMRDADLHIVAWGPLAKLPRQLRDRWREIGRLARKVGCPLHCLGTALDGHPRHPLTLAYATPLALWATTLAPSPTSRAR